MAEDEQHPPVRVDIWTWAVRLFKTRARAAAGCRNNRVQVNGNPCKPSRLVRTGDRIEVTRGFLTREVEVKNLITKRVGAAVVSEHLIDHTTEEVYEAAAERSRQLRAEGATGERVGGRPTKRDRRKLEELMDDSESELRDFEEFAKAMRNSRRRK